MKKPLLLSLLMVLVLFGQALAQNRSISGRVLDASNNDGLPGVSVLVKGTSIGTATNADGRYTLAVPDNATTLVFKYLGYTTLERPITSTAIDVSMAVDAKQLNEVTVLGVKREERAVGYAVSTIKTEQVVQKSEPDILRTISGKVPGVNIVSSSGVPGSSSRITIRGNTSMLGNNQPLFIVDGVPYDNSQTESENQLVRGAGYSGRTADIDPNNIETFTVLKGAAAAALYGSRAAGGVIVITTKTGSGKRGAKGVQVGYSTSYSMEKLAGLPEYQNSYGNGANFTGPFTTNGSWGPRFGGPGSPTTIPHPQAGNVGLGIADTAVIPYQAYPNNVKDYFKTGHVFENSINLSGSGDNTSFSAVLSRADNKGIIPNSFFIRNNVSAGGSGTFNKLTVGGNVGYTNSEQRGPQLGANNAVGNATAFARTLFLPRNLDLQGLPYIDPITKQSLFGWLSQQADNPIWSTENNAYTSRVDRVVGSVNMSYAFKEWLTLSYSGGLNTYTDLRRTTVRPGSLGYGGVGNVLEDNIQNTELEQTLLLTVDKNLTEDISLRASVGQNINQRKFEFTAFQGSNIIVFGIDNIENTEQKGTNGYDYSKRRLMGILGDATVGYKEFAFLTVSGRNDWSSTLNKNGELGNSGRSFFYPSVNGSLLVNEAFKLDYNWLTLLKLRAGYGRVGRDASPYDAGPTRYIINPGFGNPGQQLGTQFPFNGIVGLGISSQIGNPALTPEFTSDIDVGVDLGFLKDRVTFTGTYYKRRSTSQIAPRALPSATGYGSEITNFGELSNEGQEVSLTVVPIKTNDFTWSSTNNFYRNRNIVVELAEGIDQIPFGSSFGSGVIQALLKPGQPYGVFYGSVAARDEKGNLLIDPVTGRPIDDPNPQIIGNPNPDFQMNFINNFTYKGLNLSVLVDFRKGGDIYSTTVEQMLGRGVTKDTEDREKLVIIKGVQGDVATRQPIRNGDGVAIPNTTPITVNDYYFSGVPGLGSAAINAPAEFSVYDATTVRLREISLGYSLPKTMLEKTPFNGVTVSLSGRNLWWYSPNIPKYTNFDPETSTFGSSNAQGFEYTNAPNTTRYGVNLRVNF
ncbi:SusC/RagA family TonB-linked outer membrane protein [Hymenobacter sp. BT175]|uniref:SusC/RagA family TonB-linked outer membrane protein n=1 Tax=Hymenobacter translucens TaxID=2886507 RepID=UPI001D0F01C1|nr:SusC/RagA family TonB-linked outer membrane protein [Hymenobacter translucens]MCC2546999.1 SusC/RagA family TonB-linked outer membrane protein [Hymenobacter translucens]